MGTMLEGYGLSFTEEQSAGIARIGREFDAEFDRLQSAYTEESSLFGKLVDELALKREYMGNIQDTLTPEQRDRRRGADAPRGAAAADGRRGVSFTSSVT